MSTSFIYHAFGLHGYDYIKHEVKAGTHTIYAKPKTDNLRCAVCRSYNVLKRGVIKRRLLTTPLGTRAFYLILEVPRLECKRCKNIRQMRLAIASPKKTYTKRFANFVYELSQKMTLLDIANLLHVGWDLVKRIVKDRLYKKYKNINFSNLKNIAIDEISIKKGHKYITLVMDLDIGAIVFVGDGKGADALIPFWEKVKKAGAKLKAISTDLSRAYISSVLTHAPSTPLVFDHFHVVKLMNDAVSELRRNLYRELKDGLEKKVLKGSRWILLKNPDNLDETRKESQRLHDALKLNEPLAKAYYLKEDLRQIWSQESKEMAELCLDDWIKKAQSSGIRPLMKMAKTLQFFKFGLLNWYDHKITTAKLEGTNNKIKTLKRQAYGFRDMEFFKLRIFNIHNAKYALYG